MSISAEAVFKPAVPVNTGMPLPLERFYFWEKNHPNRVCFTQPMGDGSVLHITWAEAGAQARRMASWLQAAGVHHGDRVAILSKNCAWWIISDIAIWMAGGVSVPIYPTSSATTIEQILRHSGSKVLVVGKLDHWKDQASGVPGNVQCVAMPFSPDPGIEAWNDICAKTPPMSGHPRRTHLELATIIYTSGTTGTPKGVMHTFGGMASAAGQASTLYEVSSRDRLLSYLPLSHVAERMCVEIIQIYQGTHVFFADSLETFAQDLQRCRPTVFFAVPRIWAKFQAGIYSKMPEQRLNMLLKLPVVSRFVRRKIVQGLGLDYCRFALSGAAPMPVDLLHWYQSLGLELLEVYGMTENLGYSHATRRGRAKAGYVGQPNPGVEVRLGENNEVLVRSACTMVGYYKDAEKTAEALDEKGFLHTGDVGSIDNDGSLKITGRIKEIFKSSKGKYVAPFPIENRFLANPHIEQICVIGASLAQPVALVMLAEGDRLHLQEPGRRDDIRRSLRQTIDSVNPVLEPHERIAALVVVHDEWTIDSGEMTPTLKIKRNVLEEKYAVRLANWAECKGDVIWES